MMALFRTLLSGLMALLLVRVRLVIAPAYP